MEVASPGTILEGSDEGRTDLMEVLSTSPESDFPFREDPLSPLSLPLEGAEVGVDVVEDEARRVLTTRFVVLTKS